MTRLEDPVASQARGRTLLSAEELGARRGHRDVLRGITLSLRAGETVALLGPNGAGKSTLLDVFAGALSPAHGRVAVSGRVAVALQAPDLARRSALANVELALTWWGVPRSERRARALEALDAVGAAALASRPAAGLSGGERRRVHIARALAVRPDLLLLDEPFAGLDGDARTRLLEDLATVLRAPGRATLVVVHNRGEAWAFADRLLILSHGELVADGAPTDLLERPPSPLVARLLGYDGHVQHDGSVLLTRPAHVRVGGEGAEGALPARVTRVLPREDGARVELEVAGGSLSAVVAPPLPQPGAAVSVVLTGGVRFRAGADRNLDQNA